MQSLRFFPCWQLLSLSLVSELPPHHPYGLGGRVLPLSDIERIVAGNPKNIVSFDKLADRLGAGEGFLAIGNSDVPVGQYTQKIFAHYGLDEAALASSGVLTYGSNVKEVTTQVSEGAVDCGIIYATDAFSAGLDTVDEATADMCGQVIYPAAVLKNSAHADEAKAFLEYLTGDEAGKVFESVGFTPLA